MGEESGMKDIMCNKIGRFSTIIPRARYTTPNCENEFIKLNFEEHVGNIFATYSTNKQLPNVIWHVVLL